jgi:hypothetical protein
MPVIDGRYALSDKSRSGGMADVCQAIDMKGGLRQVAVKVFKHRQIEADILACNQALLSRSLYRVHSRRQNPMMVPIPTPAISTALVYWCLSA